MAQSFRLPEGGVIDRSKSLRFSFDGRSYEGHPGDTLASALLANGVHLVGRSFKYHRPRGIFSAGAEEPNALVQLGEDPRTDPNQRATQVELFDGLTAMPQHCWPSLEFDLSEGASLASRFLPSGFYYKTFMWPNWKLFEGPIRHAAGLGRAPRLPDPDRYDKTYAHCDLLVVGGGPAGLAAALAAGRRGARVLLVEQDSTLGGHLLSSPDSEIDGQPAAEWVEAARAELESLPEVRVLTRSTCFAYYDHNFLGVLEKVTDHYAPYSRPQHLPRQRMWKVRAAQVVLASGAIERPPVFRDNDRPGIMLASAASAYLRRWGVKPGGRALVLTNNDSGYRAALDLKNAGVDLAAVIDLRLAAKGPLSAQARDEGIPIRSGYAVTGTQGHLRLRKAFVAPMDGDGGRVFGGGEPIECDLLAVSGGWNPTVHLFCQSKGSLEWDEQRACFRPARSMQRNQAVVGGANGTFALGEALREAHAAGLQAAEAAGFAGSGSERPAPHAGGEGDFLPLREIYLVPSTQPVGQGGKHFVDQQHDVAASDLLLALREGYRSIEHVKRYTTTGMATDQGKTSNVNAIGIVAEHLGKPVPEVGVTTFRPPYTAVTFGAFAGRDVDGLLDPERTTPMHGWHQAQGAAFEDVGQWKRAWYYPRPGEDLHAAVAREVKATRDSLGILDATTLGKIEVCGPDAARFLDLVYTNMFSTLKVGRCRYGLMLKEDGMVLDDGVTSRLAEDRFLMTTTTGGAANVLDWLEEWLQTEWPEMKVYLTSVTEQWATMTISGPKAKALLGEVSDLKLDSETFPHMSFAEGRVAGVKARVFRISFTGEMSFEINVPARYGLAVWETLIRAGAKYAITPYGTEAMHVLRAEKGFIIVGQETDGSVTPLDLGMNWIVSKKKPDFLGRRSLFRPDMQKPDRKQLVGLMTEDGREVLPEGAQLVESNGAARPPVPMVGHVTSSYWSPNCGKAIALALVKGGQARMGQRLYAPLADRTVACTITEPVFFDKAGERLHG
ncbi:sarcosine oxidase subunit alpha family protein [Aquibaculum sediminis]|uniref:sarcosine oxidase subunit alpha family protein n=1 Tax=Aquibaculum sediminis TaxID=3231907 RepID=UPI003451F2F0